MVSDHELILDVSLYHITHSALECPEFAPFWPKKNIQKKISKPLRTSMVIFSVYSSLFPSRLHLKHMYTPFLPFFSHCVG